jgi:hypothetical protein
VVGETLADFNMADGSIVLLLRSSFSKMLHMQPAGDVHVIL